ncbi:hypothetical protein A1Q2_06669 [Trichosporon asahii var. asahii CBS 8904]|uniref:ferric-chelate reductase (NADPH) n=1 Tax=Trichosporon asahii var. asahii (strain CBS 8904) TaxID=1220162 RepID=K1VDH8_TRIAC|nr:hypothetical protein A1Q2_06669 [Trichosporon asahii var. asahii CBS 8904]
MPRVDAPVTAQQAAAAYTPPYQAVFTPYATPSIYGSPTAARDFASYRYAYLLWCIIGLIAILYAVSHHLRLSGGSLGAAYNKWGMRRHTMFRQSTLPSNSTMLVAFIVAASAIVLCIAGNDYITPLSAVWDFRSSKRDIIPGAPIGNIAKSFWTSGSRFGYMAFALFPLVVLLALKSAPFAIFSIRPFTHLHADKLMPFHRMAGYFVWLITTVHVVLWTVQLFQDSYKGQPVWVAAWTNYHFIFGVVAYALMTAMVVMSVRPVRKTKFEVFYASHTLLGVALLITSILHHTVIWWWCAIALGLWAGDRITRWIRYLRINSGASSKADPRGGQAYQGVATDNIALEEFHDKMVKDPFETNYDHSAQPEIRPVGAYESRYHDATPPPGSPSYDQLSNPYDSPRSVSSPRVPPKDSDEQTLTSYHQNRVSDITPESPPIEPGFAQAQLLPSRTVRLTIRTPHKIRWSPGQYVFLTLPELSGIQSHPFTIANNDPNEIVLLIKARRGITRRLYNLVKDRSESSLRSADKRQSIVPKANPVYIRTKLEGPHGSSGRVRWGEFSTVLIICGGSGVSYGLSIVDHIARSMANFEQDHETRRVRFVWVAREYAELAWAASALCRARRLLGPEQLQIDIYVTNANLTGQDKLYDDFSLQVPKAPFAGLQRNASSESLASQLSTDPRSEFDHIDAEMEATDANIRDLTQFDSEDDVHDHAQNDFSRHIQKEGKLRRAKTRRAMKARESIGGGYNGFAVHHGEHAGYDQGYDMSQMRAAPPGGAGGDDDLGLYPPQPLASPIRANSPYGSPSAPAKACMRQDARVLYTLGPEFSPAGGTLWIDEADYAATSILSESARGGRPKLAALLEEELDKAQGAMVVTTCGPSKLNTVVSNLVSRAIKPGRIRQGDRRGHVVFYSEDFES